MPQKIPSPPGSSLAEGICITCVESVALLVGDWVCYSMTSNSRGKKNRQGNRNALEGILGSVGQQQWLLTVDKLSFKKKSRTKGLSYHMVGRIQACTEGLRKWNQIWLKWTFQNKRRRSKRTAAISRPLPAGGLGEGLFVYRWRWNLPPYRHPPKDANLSLQQILQRMTATGIAFR